MFILPSQNGTPTLIISATDVADSTGCLYAAARTLDERTGRTAAFTGPADVMATRAAELGQEHEARVLAGFIERYGAGVVEIPALDAYELPGLQHVHGLTMAALRSDADVIYQAALFDGSFYGRADFLVRQPDGSWGVYDTKLAQSAKTAALLQLAAYTDQLLAAGVPVHPEAHLILGTGEETVHPLKDILASYRRSRSSLAGALNAHLLGDDPADWTDPQWNACLKKSCDHCTAAINETGDLLMVRGMRKNTRAKLIGMGVASFQDLLTAQLPDDEVLLDLQEQARLQAGTADVDGSRGGVSWQLKAGHTLDMLPDPDPGDIFFDFEGDPMYRDPVTGQTGLEYMFGLVEATPGHPYTAFTAHDGAAERQALIDFVDFVTTRLDENPDLRIYHYAPYEATALRKLARRHQVKEGDVEFIIGNVLFDLLPVVRSSLRISETSMSIKKLEPLYMDETRTGVSNGADSVAEYGHYRAAAAAGDGETARELLDGLLSYNEYDCYSTLKLRDWLLSIRPALVPA